MSQVIPYFSPKLKERRKMNRKKTIAATAFLIFLICILLIPFFSNIVDACWRHKPHKPRRPPLGKYIDVGIFCAETEEPVPDGLAVRLVGMGYDITMRTVKGHVLFGSGIPDGTYTLSWWWNGPYEDTVTIDCSQITWHFDYYVPNPVIIKHFYYDISHEGYPPIVGLNVSLLENGVPIAWQLTDATGTVTFGGDFVDVCKEYYLTWTYGGVDSNEGPIHFAYNADGKLLECVWEGYNYLEPKSGERQK